MLNVVAPSYTLGHDLEQLLSLNFGSMIQPLG